MKQIVAATVDIVILSYFLKYLFLVFVPFLQVNDFTSLNFQFVIIGWFVIYKCHIILNFYLFIFLLMVHALIIIFVYVIFEL